MESLTHIVLGDDPRMGDLQGDLVIEREVESEKNLTHAPAAPSSFSSRYRGPKSCGKGPSTSGDQAGNEKPQRLTFTENCVHGRTNGRWGKEVPGWLLLVHPLRPIGQIARLGR